MKIEELNKLIVADLLGVISYEQSILLSAWIEESEDNRKIYCQIRDIAALNQALGCAVEDKNRVYQRITKVNRIRRIVATAAVVATLFISFGIWTLIDSQHKNEMEIIAETIEKSESEVIFISGENIYEISNEIDTIDLKGGKIENNAQNKILKFQSKAENQSVENKIIVPAGRTYKVELSDGTQVTLNAMSTLTFASQFNSDSREVTLDGEAFFEVTHDAKRQFVVKTACSRTVVFGTTFNVNAYKTIEKEIISLVSGSVAIGNGRVEQKLKPGKQALIANDLAIEVVDFKQDEVLGWMNSMFIFEDRSLGEIISALERWYNVKFEYTNDNLKSIEAYVKIKKSTPLDELLNAISSTNRIKFTVEGDKITISPKLQK